MPANTACPSAHRFEINVCNECPASGVSEKKLIGVARKILRDLGFKKAVVNILLVGGQKMRVLNQRYLKHAWSTDVLAFGQGKVARKPVARKAAGASKDGQEKGSEDFLGDIALCLPTIAEQAEEYGHSFEEELDYCLCHGILHLLGHKDKTRPERKRMHRKQQQILDRIRPGI